MTKDESAPGTADKTELPAHRIEIHQDVPKGTWWSDHKAPCVIATSGRIAWATLATFVHEHADCEGSAFRDACLAHGLNPETGLHPSGQAFDIFINGEKHA